MEDLGTYTFDAPVFFIWLFQPISTGGLIPLWAERVWGLFLWAYMPLLDEQMRLDFSLVFYSCSPGKSSRRISYSFFVNSHPPLSLSCLQRFTLFWLASLVKIPVAIASFIIFSVLLSRKTPALLLISAAPMHIFSCFTSNSTSNTASSR